MIVRMSKYAFMVYHKEYDRFLEKLRDLGVLHVVPVKSAKDNPDLRNLLEERKRTDDVLRFCKELKENVASLQPARSFFKEDGLLMVGQVEQERERKTQLISLKAAVEKELSYMELWGEFSYDATNKLAEAGYTISFFTCPTSKFEPAWVDLYNAVLINNVQSVAYFVTVTKTVDPIDIDADRPKMPDLDIRGLQLRNAELEAEITKTEHRLESLVESDYNTLVAFSKQLEDEFNLRNVWLQTGHEAEDRLMTLEGWLPSENAPAMKESLDKDGYFCQELEIQDEDDIPIKLKNNKFSRLYEPITKMFSLPNYTEFDPTPFLAPFFMLFFGLCFGDGGYGILVILICAFMKRKVSAEYKPYLSLFQYLGLAALIVGTLTGSFFGIALVEVPAFASVKQYFLTSDNLMTLSIVLGLIQIVFGKTVAALKIMSQRGSKYGIAPLAWVFVIIALACAFGLPMLNMRIPDQVVMALYGVTAVGLLVAFLYNSPGKNIFLNFGTGLWNTYNMASGLLGDTLSYIRLFAIGLTGSILGGVFNSLAIDMTADLNIVLRIIFMTLILLVGHTINIGLCTISSLVHPLRLIFVEYYKNAEFEGGGKSYEPFKKA